MCAFALRGIVARWVLAAGFAAVSSTACTEQGHDVCAADGTVFDRSSFERVVGQRELRRLVICWAGDPAAVLQFDGLEVVQSLEVPLASAAMRFPSLVSLNTALFTSGAVVEMPELEDAGDFYVRADGLTLVAERLRRVGTLTLTGERNHVSAALLTDVDFLGWDSTHGEVLLPSLASVHIAADLRGDLPALGELPFRVVGDLALYDLASTTVSFPNLIQARSLSIASSANLKEIRGDALSAVEELYLTGNSELEALQLPALSSANTIGARNNPLLRDCTLEELARQAGVPDGQLVLEGNASGSCP